MRAAVERTGPACSAIARARWPSLGWALDTQTKVVSDVNKLVPQDSRALRDLQRAAEGDRRRRGEIDVIVRGRRPDRPARSSAG